jgi:hypothetical protein
MLHMLKIYLGPPIADAVLSNALHRQDDGDGWQRALNLG